MSTMPSPSNPSTAAIQPCRFLDDPAALYQRRVCLLPVSKNLRGDLQLCFSDLQECHDPDCVTFKTDHLLRLEVASEDCDGGASQCLNGPPGVPVFLVRNLVHALITDSDGRGPHTGDFMWQGQCMTVVGEMSGMTNVGTHRRPVFGPCQECNTLRVMEGRLVGRVMQAEDERLVGCCLTAVYRFCLEAGKKMGNVGVTGTLEGVIVCPCEEGTTAAPGPSGRQPLT